MKIIRLIILILIIFLTAGIVSAGDVNDSEIILQSGEGSFKELNNLIVKSPENSIVNLSKDYFSNDNDFPNGIEVNKPLTINGNNHVIDANSNSRIFRILTPGVILNDIVFVNGNARNGGAIQSNYCVTIDDCRFENNYAYKGGAIHVKNAKINNSVFINNFAKAYGGAIYQKNGDVNNSKFINNNVPQGDVVTSDNTILGYGGAIYQIDSNVYSSTFSGNNAFGGGAIQQAGSNIYKSIFVGNSAFDAGAVKQYEKSNIFNSTFIDNSASAYGGAV